MPTTDPEPRATKSNRGPAAGPGNRSALIAAAREVYADDGLSAPFSAVAKRAGVGQGSLYRHFPDRTALAVAVFEENLERSRGVHRARGSHDRRPARPGRRRRRWSRPRSSTSSPANLHDPRVAPLGIRFRDVVARLLARERALGHVGAHIEVDDVTMATGMLATELARAEPDQRADVARRARALFRAAFAPR